MRGGGGGRGTMQTFSFADSKLGYLTASKGALVVRVKSCAMPRRDGTASMDKILVAAASGDSDVTTERCSHMADETGNFTLVPRRFITQRQSTSAS